MINVTKLDFDLKAAGIPIDGVSSEGRIDFTLEATDAQREQAAQILASHDPSSLTPQEQSKQDATVQIQTLNGKDIKTLTNTDMVTIIRFFLAQSGWIGSGDTIQVLA